MVQGAPEGLLPLEPRHVRLSGVASRQHEVLRSEYLRGTIRHAQVHSPRASILVVPGQPHGGVGPDVEIHYAGVGLEPVGELILWGEERPRRREVQVRHVADLDRVMKDECLVPVTPVVADTSLTVDHEVRDPKLIQTGRQVETSLA